VGIHLTLELQTFSFQNPYPADLNLYITFASSILSRGSGIGLIVNEFELLLPTFQAVYQRHYPVSSTPIGQTSQCRVGGGRKSPLDGFEQKLLFALVY
jgi:hypothetical protein